MHNKNTIHELIREFYPYAKEKMGFDKPCRVFLRENKENSADPLGKTAYYVPESMEIHLYTTGRHPKIVKDSLKIPEIQTKDTLRLTNTCEKWKNKLIWKEICAFVTGQTPERKTIKESKLIVATELAMQARKAASPIETTIENHTLAENLTMLVLRDDVVIVES